ncbi:DUF6168 family protein [Aestuariivivens marinum]|uniref:DUF6168 family protein n=1 Tax=Aestuariivivens marinum TaxID=2913555 RepID=UPI001F59E2BF|nr:DUF6168 family protein [Aestuariivivens marinum]
MQNPFYRFTVKVTGLLAITFVLHLGFLKLFEQPLFENKIVLSYIVNLLLVIGVFGLLYILRNKYKSQLGFLFLAGSVLKFTIFFIVFYPIYKQDEDVSKLEFAAFFIPYATGLILETLSLSKWLNEIDQ